MKIHEYQAKELLRAFGVPTPTGKVVTTADEAVGVLKAHLDALSRGRHG